MKSLAFVDNFVVSPVIHSINDYINHSQLPCTYHMPAKFGMSSLYKLKKFDGIVLLGSASHVTIPESWHQELLDFVLPKLESGIPVLGICFGHQLMAHAYGSTVDYHRIQDGVEVKYKHAREIEITMDCMGLKKGEKLCLGNSHSQVVKELGPDLISFASSVLGPNEAITHRKYPLWSFQSHPEASAHFLAEDAQIQDPIQIETIVRQGHHLLDLFVQQL